MELMDENSIQMELKYCERCGGLWLRLRGSDLVYCAACAVILAGIARDPRCLQPHGGGVIQTLIDEDRVQNMFWSEGGQA
ncbi:MAG TPA: hypothetical protein VLW06_12655 [Terriglobales bacterium]|nr:hypothetical protein [Terriglobales bacterium]